MGAWRPKCTPMAMMKRTGQSSHPSASCSDASKKEESPRPESPYHAFSPRRLGISARTGILINHPRPPRPTRRLLNAPVFARAKLRSKAASAAFCKDEPTGQGYVAGKSRAHARAAARVESVVTSLAGDPIRRLIGPCPDRLAPPGRPAADLDITKRYVNLSRVTDVRVVFECSPVMLPVRPLKGAPPGIRKRPLE